MAKSKAEGKFHILSEEINIKIMQELNEGDEEFNIAEKIRRTQSELELKNIILY